MGSMQRAVERSAELFSIIGQTTSDGVGITRASYGEGEQIAHDIVADEARALGLDVATDAALNLRMTLPGSDRSVASVLIGSHLDSAPRGGNFDGLAGVLAGLACLRAIRETGRGLDRDVSIRRSLFGHSTVLDRSERTASQAHRPAP